jgi:hypothetical protein
MARPSSTKLLPFVTIAAMTLSCGQGDGAGFGDARLVLARPSQAVSSLSRMTLTVAPGNVAGQGTFEPFTAELGPTEPWSVFYSGIPAGMGRILTVDAVDAALARYSGSAVVDVPAGGTVAVAIALQPSTPTHYTPNSTPVVDRLTIDAISVPIGATVSLSASAHDPDVGDVVGYLWSTTQPCGTFAGTGRPDTTRPTTIWEAPFDPRTCRLTLLVTDGRGGSVSVYVDVGVTP